MKVSILTSVYNKGPWLSKCFESVCGQTYKDIEFIVVDDASTDNSAQIIAKYAARDNRIKVVTLETNRGPAGGMNVAINNATGDYMTVIDADDFLDSNYIQVLYDALVETGADMSMCVNDLVFPNGRTWHKAWPPQGRHIIEGNDAKLLPCQLLDELSNRYFGFHMPEMGAEWNKLLKRSIVEKYSVRYNESLWIWCDFDFYLQYIWHVNKVVYTTDTVYHFYQSENSVTRASKFNISKLLYVIDALESMEKQLKGREFKELTNAYFMFVFLRLKDVCNELTYRKKEIPLSDYKQVYNRLFNSSPIQRLFKAKDLPCLNARGKIYLKLVKKGHIKEAVFFNRIYFAVSRRLKKIIKPSINS